MLTSKSNESEIKARNSKSKEDVAKAVENIYSQLLNSKEDFVKAKFTSQELFNAPCYRYYDLIVSLRKDERILALVSNSAKNINSDYNKYSKEHNVHAQASFFELNNISKSALDFARAKSVNKK